MNEELFVKIGIYVSVVVVLLAESDSFLNDLAKLFLLVMVGYCLVQGVINLP